MKYKKMELELWLPNPSLPSARVTLEILAGAKYSTGIFKYVIYNRPTTSLKQ